MMWDIIGDILRLTVLGGLGAAGILAILIWKKNLASRVTFLRFVIQAVSFAAMFYIFSYTIPMLYILIFVFVMSLVLGRFFCGWLCPFAFLMDIVVVVRKAVKVRYRLLSEKLNNSLNQLRYVIMLVFLLLPIALWLLEPPPNMDFAIIMAQLFAGPFRPYSILLDPMVPLIVPWSSAPLVISEINFTYPYVQDIITYAGQNIGQIIGIVFVAITLVGSFFIRRVWCRFCPTGCSMAAVNKFKGFQKVPALYIEKDEEKCTKCGVCKRVCPAQVTEVYEQKGGKIITSMCMQCFRCVEMCPYKDALKVKLGKWAVFKSRDWLQPSTIERGKQNEK